MLAGALSNLASLYERMGRLEDAYRNLNRAVSIYDVTLPPGHPKLASTVNTLATVLVKMGHGVAAEAMYRRVIELGIDEKGVLAFEAATALNNLAALKKENCAYEEASDLYERAIQLWRDVVGGRSQDLAVTYNNLAGLRTRQARFDEAEQLYQRSILLHEQVLGARNRYLIPPLEGYAYFLLVTNHPEQAQVLIKRSNQIRDQHDLDTVTMAQIEDRDRSCGDET